MALAARTNPPSPRNPGRTVPRHSCRFMGNPGPGCGGRIVPAYSEPIGKKLRSPPIATPYLSSRSCCSHHAVQLTRQASEKLRNAVSSVTEGGEERAKGRNRGARRNRPCRGDGTRTWSTSLNLHIPFQVPSQEVAPRALYSQQGYQTSPTPPPDRLGTCGVFRDLRC